MVVVLFFFDYTTIRLSQLFYFKLSFEFDLFCFVSFCIDYKDVVCVAATFVASAISNQPQYRKQCDSCLMVNQFQQHEFIALACPVCREDIYVHIREFEK